MAAEAGCARPSRRRCGCCPTRTMSLARIRRRVRRQRGRGRAGRSGRRLRGGRGGVPRRRRCGCAARAADWSASRRSARRGAGLRLDGRSDRALPGRGRACRWSAICDAAGAGRPTRPGCDVETAAADPGRLRLRRPGPARAGRRDAAGRGVARRATPRSWCRRRCPMSSPSRTWTASGPRWWSRRPTGRPLPAAEEKLYARGVTVIPDFVANVATNAWWWWTLFGDIEPAAARHSRRSRDAGSRWWCGPGRAEADGHDTPPAAALAMSAAERRSMLRQGSRRDGLLASATGRRYVLLRPDRSVLWCYARSSGSRPSSRAACSRTQSASCRREITRSCTVT